MTEESSRCKKCNNYMKITYSPFSNKKWEDCIKCNKTKEELEKSYRNIKNKHTDINFNTIDYDSIPVEQLEKLVDSFYDYKNEEDKKEEEAEGSYDPFKGFSWL